MYLTIVFLTFVSLLTVAFFGRFFGFYGSALLSTSCLILAFFCSVFIFYEVAFSSFFSMYGALDFWQFLHSDSFIYILTLFVLGNIMGWPFIFSIIKQPSTLKQKFANGYIIFLVSVLNHGKPPAGFIFFTIGLGMFLGRRLILFLSVPYPKSLLIIFFFPFVFFYLNFVFIYGYFVLCVKYPKIFGKLLLNFFERNADKEILRLIQPCKKEFSLNKKKSALKKRKLNLRVFQRRKGKK